MSVRTALLMSATLLLGGCAVSSEIGKECLLVRKANPDVEEEKGLRFVVVKEKEVAPNQDFISFGSIECEDLVCVRDADFPRDPDQEAVAKGYCSKACVEGSTSCEVKDTNGVVEGLKDRMTCRALLLDQETLEALRAADPTFYRQTFGDNNSPYFCAGTPSSQQGN